VLKKEPVKPQKTIVHEEPAWKKRQREYDKQARRGKLHTVLIVGAIVIVFAFLAGMTARNIMRSSAKKTKEKPIDGIARVEGKQILHKDGKDQDWIIFKVQNQTVDKQVSEKDYAALQKGDVVKVSYTGIPQYGTTEILSWSPLKLAPMPEKGKDKPADTVKQ
jgi:hypothetical protein